MKDFHRDRLARLGLLLVSVAMGGVALITLAKGGLFYRNYWGGLIFAPFTFLIVPFTLYFAIRGFPSEPKHRNTKVSRKAARRAMQARNTKFPIDDFQKW